MSYQSAIQVPIFLGNIWFKKLKSYTNYAKTNHTIKYLCWHQWQAIQNPNNSTISIMTHDLVCWMCACVEKFRSLLMICAILSSSFWFWNLVATGAARFSMSFPLVVSTYQKILSWKSTLRVPNLSASYVSPLLYVIKLSDFTLSLDIGWCSCSECDIANSL